MSFFSVFPWNTYVHAASTIVPFQEQRQRSKGYQNIYSRSSNNRATSQIPQSDSQISHNAYFCNIHEHICAHFCQKMMHWYMGLVHHGTCASFQLFVSPVQKNVWLTFGKVCERFYSGRQITKSGVSKQPRYIIKHHPRPDNGNTFDQYTR